MFVESLDRAFENVCELDLVFHFDEVSKERSGRSVVMATLMVTRYITYYQK